MGSGWERDVEFHQGWDLCLCGGDGIDVSDGGGGVEGSGGNSGAGDAGESIVYRSGGGSGSVAYGSRRAGLCRSG